MTHFTDEETEAQLSPTLCPESQLVRGRRWTQPQGVGSNPDALRGVPGPRQALSKGGFSSLREAEPSNRETVRVVAGVQHCRGARGWCPPPASEQHPRWHPARRTGLEVGTLPDPPPGRTERKPRSDTCFLVGKLGGQRPPAARPG